jgi:coenzyme F420-reducing hydrogenase gamma subunit
MTVRGTRPKPDLGGRPRLAVIKLASCDGCQLTLLDCEDELLAITGAVDVVYFNEATSRPDDGDPFDLTLIEGSVSVPEQLDLVRSVRARSKALVAIGACANAGGIQALRNFADSDEFARVVYATPETIETLATSTPVSAHVLVDFELRGCPIAKEQLVEVITAMLVGRRPAIANESLCAECKRQGHVCVLVARGEPCLGPVTHTGCGVLCPSHDRGCYGCFGPRERAATTSLADWFAAQGMVPADRLRRFRSFYGALDPFRSESERHER